MFNWGSTSQQKIFQRLQNETTAIKYKTTLVQLVHYVIQATKNGKYDDPEFKMTVESYLEDWDEESDDSESIQGFLHIILFHICTTCTTSDLLSTQNIAVHDFLVFKSIDPYEGTLARLDYVSQTISQLHFIIRGVLLIELVDRDVE